MPHQRRLHPAATPGHRLLRPHHPARVALALLLLLCASVAQARKPHPVHTLLDEVHAAASKADFSAYFDRFTPSGLFVGTDPTEVWSIDQFKEYARPVFAKGKGWTYVPDKTTRTVRPLDTGAGSGSFAFHERLTHAKYGTLHGSGVVVTHEGKLKVDMYVLSFAIPNDKAKACLKAIE